MKEIVKVTEKGEKFVYRFSVILTMLHFGILGLLFAAGLIWTGYLLKVEGISGSTNLVRLAVRDTQEIINILFSLVARHSTLGLAGVGIGIISGILLREKITTEGLLNSLACSFFPVTPALAAAIVTLVGNLLSGESYNFLTYHLKLWFILIISVWWCLIGSAIEIFSALVSPYMPCPHGYPDRVGCAPCYMADPPFPFDPPWFTDEERKKFWERR